MGEKSCKVLSMILCIVLVLGMSACGESTVDDVNSKSKKELTQPETTSTKETTENENKESKDDSGKEIDTLVIGTTASIKTANRSEYNFDVITGTLSQLAPVSIDEKNNYHPLLCEYTTEDNQTWTLKVRDGMTWHDGKAVTAEDIKFTLEYLDLQEGGGYADSYEAINVVDDKTIELTLAAPNPRLLSNLTTLRILPKHIYDGVEDYAAVANVKANIGCGPYIFQRFDAEAGVVEFKANEKYPDGLPAVGTVIIKLFDNADTMYMALKSEKIHMVYTYAGGADPSVIPDLKSSGNITLQPVTDSSNTAVLIFNTATAPGKDSNIRKAVAAAIDYNKFRELFGSEYSIPSRAGFIPQGTIGYTDTEVLNRNLDAANAYLEAAGAADSDRDGIVEYKGAPLTIRVMVRSDKEVHARFAELLKANLKEAGILLEIDVKETADFREATENQHSQQAVISKLTSFGMAKKAGLGTLYMIGTDGMSYGQIQEEGADAIAAKLETAKTLEEYHAAAKEMQEYYANTMPGIALFWDSYVQAYNSRLNGFQIDGTFGILNVGTWYRLTMDK